MCGLVHKGTQKRLLSEPDLTFKRVVELAQGIETTEKSILDFRKRDDPLVKKLDRGQQKISSQSSSRCQHCGRTNHVSKDYCFKEAVCHSCNSKGHIAPVCPNLRHNKQHQRWRRRFPYKYSPNTKWLEEGFSNNSDDFHMFQIGSSSHSPITLQVRINGVHVPMELDTGAAVSVISRSTKQKYLPNVPLLSTRVVLRTYTNEKLPVAGEMKFHLVYEDQQKTVTLYVLDGESPSIFGCDWLSVNKLNWRLIKWTTTSKGDPDIEAVLSKEL